MPIQSFDYLSELIKEEITADESAIRYWISPEKKHNFFEVYAL